VPYPRYGESPEGVCALISEQADAIAAGATRTDLLTLMKAGAARNAVDCALLDLEAKQRGRPAWEIAGLSPPQVATTAYTLSLGTPESMEEAARGAAHRPLLKVKLGGEGDPERIAAVRRGAPESRLIVDANEGWTEDNLARHLDVADALGISLIEQPLPAGKDAILATIRRKVMICADESVHATGDLASLRNRYDAVNIKLDKTGGLTEALIMKEEAQRLGFAVMIGCMVGTSLAMAPAVLLAQDADYADLDGPLLLAQDRPDGLRYDGSLVYPPRTNLWG
jgi:L-alanine-DL-glutamate epimerase-like enolase superfamily enzyme